MGHVPITGGREGVRPKAVDAAFRYTLTGIALGAVGAVLTTLVDRGRLVVMVREALDQSGQPYTEADVLGMVGVFRFVGGLLIALVAGLLVLVAMMMRAGRNWARITLIVVAVFGVFDFAGAVSAQGAALVLIWNLAGVAFLVAAVTQLFGAEPAKYFGRGRERR
jgi:hypothetical protein